MPHCPQHCPSPPVLAAVSVVAVAGALLGATVAVVYLLAAVAVLAVAGAVMLARAVVDVAQHAGSLTWPQRWARVVAWWCRARARRRARRQVCAQARVAITASPQGLELPASYAAWTPTPAPRRITEES